MVSFYFSQLRVQGFRSLGELVLDISDRAPTVLIGPNNAGKSTILDAVGPCLASPKFGKYVVDAGDFWTDGEGHVADVFTIELKIAARPGGTLPAVKAAFGDPIAVHGIRAVGSLEEGSTTRYLIDEHGEIIMLTVSAPVSKAKKEEFKGMGLGGRRFARISDIAKWMPSIYQLDSHNLHSSLYEWQSGPLQRLMKLYRQHLAEDPWTVEGAREMPEYLDRLHRYINEKVLQSPFWNETLSVELAGKLKEYLGRSPGFSMKPQLAEVEEWLKSELLLRVSPGEGLASVDSRRLGAGWQSLIRLAALEVVMKMEGANALLLMEEPETFLHPHLRRRMRRVFDTMQRSGSQCVITTHSSELVSFALNQEIVRLGMTVAGTAQHRYSTASAGQALKDEEKLHELGNHEIVFANFAILCEGKGDEAALRLGLEKAGVDIDAESVSIVACGGVGNIPDYARLCATLGIPWVVIHDADMQADGTQKPKTKRAVDEVIKLKGPRDVVTCWDNTLEEVLCCPHPKANPQWLLATYGSMEWADMESHTTLGKYCGAVRAAKAALE